MKFADMADKAQEYLRIRRSVYIPRGMCEWPSKFKGSDWTDGMANS